MERIGIEGVFDLGEFDKSVKTYVADLVKAGAATNDMERLQNKLGVAMHDAETAARALSDAQRKLADNTDPDKQFELQGAVLKAQTALDRETQEVSDLSGELRELDNAADGAAISEQNLGQSTRKAGISFTELNQAMEVAKKAVDFIIMGYDLAITPTLKLASQTRELSRTIGATAEQASTLIAIADDVGIEFGTFQTAMEAAIKKGVAPTVEGLTALAAEYQVLPPGVARSAFAMEHFGRAGNDLQPFLLLAPDKIREMGEAAAATGQVMSEADVQAARAWEMSLDDLQDSAGGLALEIGKELIPVLTAAADAGMLLATWDQKVATALQDHETEVVKTAGSYREYLAAMTDSYVVAEKMSAATAHLILSDYDAGRAIDSLLISNNIMNESLWRSARAIDANNAYGQAIADVYMSKVRPAIAALTDEGQALADATEAANAKQLLTLGMSGALTQAQNNYDDAVSNAKDALDQCRDAVAKTTEGTKAHWKANADAAIAESNYVVAVQNANAALERNTAQFLFNIAAQNLDDAAALKLAGDMGLLDAATVAATQTMQAQKEMLDAGNLSADQYAQATLDLQKAISALQDRHVTITVDAIRTERITQYVEQILQGVVSSADIYDVTHRAGGGPVSAGSPYIVGENGPELFVPSVAGDITNITNSPSYSSSSTFNLYVNSSAPVSSVAQDFATLQALAGAGG